MKHYWARHWVWDPDIFEKRRCTSCGAEQRRRCSVSRRWLPLAGRCKPRTPFQMALFRAMAYGGWTEVAIRREFGCSKPTLARWVSGENAPHWATHEEAIRTLAADFKKR